MILKDQIQQDYLAAMKNHAAFEVGVLRLIRGKIKDAEIERGHILNADEVVGVLNNALKQRRDAVQAYHQAGRDDLAEQEEQEARLILRYLPQPLTAAELESIVMVVIRETGAVGIKDIGRVMPKVMTQVKGRADGAQVQQLVRQKLG